MWVLLDTEDEGTTVLQNVRNYSPIDAVSHSRDWELQKDCCEKLRPCIAAYVLKAKEYDKGKPCWREFE